MGSRVEELSSLQPLANRCISLPTRDWRHAPLSRQTWHEVKTLRKALEADGYDAILDLQGAVRSAVIGRMANSQRLIGEDAPREWAARWMFTERVETQGAHMIEQDIELASAVAGDDLKPMAPLLPVNPAAESWADAVMAGPGSGKEKPAVLINPGAGWGAKRWPVERYAAVARELVQRGMRVLVNAGPGEEDLAEPISGATGTATTQVNCSVEQLIALTAGAFNWPLPATRGHCTWPARWAGPWLAFTGRPTPAATDLSVARFRVLRSPKAGVTTLDTTHRRQG